MYKEYNGDVMVAQAITLVLMCILGDTGLVNVI